MESCSLTICKPAKKEQNYYSIFVILVCTKKCFFKVFQLCLIYSLIFKVALLLDNSEKPKTYQMNAETSDDRGRVSQAHGRQMEAVGGQVVGGLRQLFGGFDQLTTSDDVSVRVVDGNVEAQRLQQDVLVRHQLLSLFLKMY